MSGEFGDMVINRLFKYTLDFKDANLFWEVFLAFDAGETTDVKIETTTDPQIAAIVARLRN
jgi:hypothetical protein